MTEGSNKGGLMLSREYLELILFKEFSEFKNCILMGVEYDPKIDSYDFYFLNK